MTYPAGGSGYGLPPARQGVNFGWISEAAALFRANPWAWVGALSLAFIIVMLVEFLLLFGTGYMSAITTAAKAGGAFAPQSTPSYWIFTAFFSAAVYLITGGLMRMACRQVRGETVTAVDFVMVGDVFGPLVGTSLLSLILGVPGAFAPTLFRIYPVAAVVLYVVVVVCSFFFVMVPVAVVADNLGPFQAVARSFDIMRRNWLPLIGYLIVLGFISFVGLLICCVGGLATYPIYFLGMAIAYLRLSAPDSGMSAYAPTPGTWPPPPGQSGYWGHPQQPWPQHQPEPAPTSEGSSSAPGETSPQGTEPDSSS